MKIVVIIGYVLYALFGFILIMKYNGTLSRYIDEVISDWPDIPNWLNFTFGLILFSVCIFAQIAIFYEAIIIWIVLLIIVPFFYLPIRNSKTYNLLSITTFFLTAFFSVTLFMSVDNSRDIIGESFIKNYKVYYTTEYYQTNYDDEREVEIAHINTGNKTFDVVLELIFPLVYRIFIGLIVIFSLLLNISLREKNKLIKEGYNKDL